MGQDELNYRSMEKKIQAVYKDGVLRLEEPLQLKEMQRVTVTITDSPAIDDDLAGYFTPEEWAAAAHDGITWDDVRTALSEISGSLSDAVTAQRQER
jgi:predicted DNA-binding antitoxin AbrB/MazE fold protein